jgi:murein L,D-transpeptidase YcbB/YkuD
LLKKTLPAFLDSAHLNERYTYLTYPYTDSLKFVRSLIHRLQEEGIISWQSENIDSATLAAALFRLQTKNNLSKDGKFGKQVVNFLNQTDREKFTCIAINLDRYKLMNTTMPKRYIWVNLPAYYLKLIENDTVKIESKVIIGKPNTRTPLLTSAITNMVTYPQWTIPNSIIIKEILPALKRNPGYLARKGYMLATWKGETVNPYTVNWAKYSKGIPYKVVQGSGDANALGILKFNFHNKYSVYLHDTNQRYLFQNSNRALSHGCVRVQAWDKLAWFISGIDSAYATTTSVKSIPVDSMRVWLDRKEKHTIPVLSRIPVYFRYFTAEAVNGKLVLYPDIYNEDALARLAFFKNK